jgi:hypothetical protein
MSHSPPRPTLRCSKPGYRALHSIPAFDFRTQCSVLGARASSRRCSQRVRDPLHTQAHTLVIDRGFADSDAVPDDETITATKTMQQAEKYRCIEAPAVQRGDVRSTRSDCSNDARSSPGPSSMQTAETGVSRCVYRSIYLAVAECRLVNRHEAQRIRLSNGTYDCS